jgi:FlaA1/EpsC-like NDP-sugar epimerase
MIELSGLKPDEDIKIVFTGLRPGEKLHEELKNDTEAAVPTSNDKIMVLTGVEPLSRVEWDHLEALAGMALEGRPEEALAVLRRLVPDYVPDVSLPLRTSGMPGQKVVGLFPKRRLDAQV